MSTRRYVISFRDETKRLLRAEIVEVESSWSLMAALDWTADKIDSDDALSSKAVYCEVAAADTEAIDALVFPGVGQ